MNSDQLLKIVEQYGRKGEAGYGDITVTRVPDQKTVFVEQIDGVGRAGMMEQHIGQDTARAVRRYTTVWRLKTRPTNQFEH